VAGKKKCKLRYACSNSYLLVIKCDGVHYLFVPQYESLSSSRIFEEAAKYPQVEQYLPEERDRHKLPRQWVINVVHTLVGRNFSDWVEDKIQLRDQVIASKHDLLIDIDPEIA